MNEDWFANAHGDLGNERMPTEIGWTRRPTVMQTSERTKFTRALMEAAGQGSGFSLLQ